MNVCTHGKFLEYTHTEVTNVMSTVYTTLDYEYRHKNKGTGIALVPKSVGCTNETKRATRCVHAVSINMKYTQNAHPLTHRSNQYNVYYLYHPRL